MNKLFTLISLPLLSLGLSKCSTYPIVGTDYSKKYNPANVFDTDRKISYNQISIDENNYSPSEDECAKLKRMILDADFKSTKETNSLTF